MFCFNRNKRRHAALIQRLEKIMSDLTDLKDKFDAASTAIIQALKDGATKIQQLSDQIAANPSPTELAALKTDLSATSDLMAKAATDFEAALNPPTV